MPGWWGGPGRAGWIPDAELGAGFHWTLAGLVAGSWALVEPDRAPAALPLPGVLGAQAPLAWADTVVIRFGEDGAWEGYDAALGRAHAGEPLDVRPAADWRPRSDVSLVSTSRGLRDNALHLWRGDTLGGLRLAAASGEREATGWLGGAGRDLYEVGVALARGAHRVEADFTHRRAGALLAGGESQDVRGEAGSGGYRYARGDWRAALGVARGYDRHDSRGPAWVEQRRLADATRASLELERSAGRQRWGVRGAWREGHVETDAAAGAESRSTEWWGAARWQGPFGEGDLELALGAGRSDAPTRTTVAPSLKWRFRGAPWQGRVTLERLVRPVWADLAPGQAPFLQDTWCGGIEVGTRASRSGDVRLGFLAGQTRGRALLVRHPLESLALRSGFRADPRVYDFVLLDGGARARRGRWQAGIEGYLMGRDASVLQPWVDPGRGGRAFLETRFVLFGGDLEVRPRAEAWAIGPRESEAVPSRALPAYVTAAAGLTLSLADATVVIEGWNLENRARPHTWVDSATGSEALGTGRDLRARFLWRLWD